MQLRAREADSYSLCTKNDEKYARVYANKFFAEGSEIGAATSIFFSSKIELMAFLKSEARPNHRRFADRLIKLEGIMHEGALKTIYGILVGVAGELMAPSQGQRANVELVLAPAQGLNPDLVKLVVKARTKKGVAKGTELLLDYGDAFDVTLPVLADGKPGERVPMLGPMGRYMKKGSWGSEDGKATVEPSTSAGPSQSSQSEAPEGEPEAKRQRTEPVLGDGEEQGEVDGAEKAQANPFEDMEKFGEGGRVETSQGHVRFGLCFRSPQIVLRVA